VKNEARSLTHEAQCILREALNVAGSVADLHQDLVWSASPIGRRLEVPMNEGILNEGILLSWRVESLTHAQQK